MTTTERPAIPAVPAALERTSCHAEPQHSPVWVLADLDDEDAWYPAPCPSCLVEEAWQRVYKLENAEEARRHRRHRWYASSKLTRKAVGWAYSMGIIAGYVTTYSAHCNGCVGHLTRFTARRPYILGWPSWKWACLRRGHWPGEYIGFDMCVKDLPCPECGSINVGHRDDCMGA